MTKKEAETIIKAASKVISNPDTMMELAVILGQAAQEVQ